MKRTFKVIIAVGIITMSAVAQAGDMYYYNGSGGEWRICRDSDGYVVYKPNGGTDAWGNGYSWDDVKKAYGLTTKPLGSRGYYKYCP